MDTGNLGFDRRRVLKASAGLLGLMGTLPLVSDPATAAEEFTEWGWPTAGYKPISDSSKDWLKSVGWWPLQVAWNPIWSCGNVLLFVMRQQKLLEKRGLEVQYSPFLSASLMNEVFIPARVQIAQAGSSGLLTLIDRKVPTAAVACYPAQRQAFMVKPSSPLKNGMQELKNQAVLKRPAVVGTTLGSAQHLGLILAAKVLGLEEGRDYVIKNATPPDLIAMPDGIDIVVMFEPNVILMEEFLKNARVIDLTDNYEVFNGYSYVRGEIDQRAPDVIQAYVDAMVEANLFVHRYPQETIAAFAEDPSQRGRNPKLIERDAMTHVVGPKPTVQFPFEDTDGFWISLEQFQADAMADAGILRRKYSVADFKSVLRPAYMETTFKKLGFSMPARPPFIPANWQGKVGHPPYPPYGLAMMGPQSFPEDGDLARDWTFGGRVYKAKS